MRKLVPLHKQSKKQRKEYNAKQRGSWNGISPVTRIVPNGKAYGLRLCFCWVGFSLSKLVIFSFNSISVI